MEIIKWVFYILLGIVGFVLVLYVVFSPFALIIGLFNPSAVLDEEKPQTRFRVIKHYGITSVIMALISFSALSSVSAEDGVSTATYSTPPVLTTASYTSAVESVPTPKPVETETWVNVKSDRALQVTKALSNDRIESKDEFLEPIEAQGGQLITVVMKLKNTGLESGNMAWTKFQLIDSQGRKYDELDFKERIIFNMLLEKSGGTNADSEMFPGQVIVTAKVFRVAPDASELKLAVNGKLLPLDVVAEA